MEISEVEYKEYLALKEASVPKKWCWVRFVTGWINKAFIAWIVTTVMINDILVKAFLPSALLCSECGKAAEKLTHIELTVAIVWGVVTVCFILGKSIETMVSNAKISAELKAGASVSKELKGN